MRHALANRQARSDAPTALFVGLEAYRAAGGRTEDPLFEDDYVTILDPELMDELAQQKLNAVAADLRRRLEVDRGKDRVHLDGPAEPPDRGCGAPRRVHR